MVCVYFIFFFFQAEDGIRDLTVTGVQTCALPISDCGLAPGMVNILAAEGIRRLGDAEVVKIYVGGLPQHPEPPLNRSEEHTSELQSQSNLVCRLLLEKKKQTNNYAVVRWQQEFRN